MACLRQTANVINGFITRRHKRHIAHSKQKTEVGEESSTTQHASQFSHMPLDKYRFSGYDLCLFSQTMTLTEAREVETESLTRLLTSPLHFNTTSNLQSVPPLAAGRDRLGSQGRPRGCPFISNIRAFLLMEAKVVMYTQHTTPVNLRVILSHVHLFLFRFPSFSLKLIVATHTYTFRPPKHSPLALLPGSPIYFHTQSNTLPSPPVIHATSLSLSHFVSHL